MSREVWSREDRDVVVTSDGAGGQLAVLEGGGSRGVGGGVCGAGPAGGLGAKGLVGGHWAREAGAQGTAVITGSVSANLLNCVIGVSKYMTTPVVVTWRTSLQHLTHSFMRDQFHVLV